MSVTVAAVVVVVKEAWIFECLHNIIFSLWLYFVRNIFDLIK
jgi:hypothetical protein